MSDLNNEIMCNSAINDNFHITDFEIVEIEPNKVIVKQLETFDGLRIILEGECYMSCDPDQVWSFYPDLMTDHRKPSINHSSLKESLNKLIIPSLKDHEIYSRVYLEETPTYQNKYFRTLIKDDNIGDFELCLKLNHNLFSITNSSTTLKLVHIPLSSFQKISKRSHQFLQNITETVVLKCKTYIKNSKFSILFHNIQTKVNSSRQKKVITKRPKSSMTDFEATLKLYEQNSSGLVPSYVPNSMNMMLKMKSSEEYWAKKIEDRKFAQEKENEIKVHYFRSAHHQTARSRNALENLKKAEIQDDDVKSETGNPSSSVRKISTAVKIPISHPSVASVWTILKAINKFKHHSSTLNTTKMARSKTHLAKEQRRLSETSRDTSNQKQDIKYNEFDFDAETSDKNLSSIELRMRNFLNSFPKTSNSDGVSTLKRFVVKGNSIPHVGGTILVRLKQCNSLEDHSHIQHHILPKNALSTLQKYRASKWHLDDL